MAKRLIDLSDPGGAIAKEALVQLKNNMVFGNLVHREYKEEFVKVGDTVNIRRPVKFVTSDGAQRVNQDVEEGAVNIRMDQRKHVSWKFSTQDMTLVVDKYVERYVKPAMITLANTVDRSVAGLYSQLWNSVGTPGTTPANFAALASGAQRLDEMAVADDMRFAALNPAAKYAIASDQTRLLQAEMVKGAYKKASIGEIASFDTYSTNNVVNHITGALAGTPLVDGPDQDVTYNASADTNSQTLMIDGADPTVTGFAKAGDVFTIAGVFAVNPVPGEGGMGKTVMPYLQEFTVLADADTSGSGAASLTIAPAIITEGPYQTVSGAPADNAALTFRGAPTTAYPQNILAHRNALALVTCPLETPDGVAFKGRESYDGLSVRIVKDYDIDTDEEIIRADILFGIRAIYPELGGRLWG